MDEMNCDLLLRESITAQPMSPAGYRPIYPVSGPFSSNFLIIECKSSDVLPHWWLGCQASINLLLTPSSYTSTPALTEFLGINCGRGRKTLIEIPPVGQQAYMVILEVPWWFSQISLAVWYYHP
ncbi:hypothetical protein [Microseira sp. BLCC-F43]|jgi:hypothetical protein|uniref:hypothetical protein n=1 Tax=Microseira sp. BLCC-F43 TaxID=3153602 RepID=UPI0035BA2270